MHDDEYFQKQQNQLKEDYHREVEKVVVVAVLIAGAMAIAAGIFVGAEAWKGIIVQSAVIALVAIMSIKWTKDEYKHNLTVLEFDKNNPDLVVTPNDTEYAEATLHS